MSEESFYFKDLFRMFPFLGNRRRWQELELGKKYKVKKILVTPNYISVTLSDGKYLYLPDRFREKEHLFESLSKEDFKNLYIINYGPTKGQYNQHYCDIRFFEETS